MPRLSLPVWTDHPLVRVLGLAFLVRDLIVTLLGVGAVVTTLLGLGTVGIVLGGLAIGYVAVSVIARRRPPKASVSDPPAVVPAGRNALRELLQEERARQTALSASGASPNREERLRAIRDEVKHIKRRFDQIDKSGDEWGTIRPPRHSLYQPLPAEKWNRHGVALMLPRGAHDVIQEAYERANDFNHEMQTPPTTFGDHPDPDLAGLREAFERAEAQLDAAEQSVRATT
jgi:hypothetical protein